MLIEWTDGDNRRRTLQVEAPYAEAMARVIESDYGGREVLVGGVRPGGPAKAYHRRLAETWEKGLHLEDGGG
jgi:hypothetical protein